MADLAGKRVIVTGGSTGIGAAIAERFLADGAKVCVWGQSQERLDAITRKLPKLAAAISVDVADGDECATRVELLGGRAADTPAGARDRHPLPGQLPAAC